MEWRASESVKDPCSDRNSFSDAPDSWIFPHFDPGLPAARDEGRPLGDHEFIELNARALARACKFFKVPVLLSTIGVKLRNDPSTIKALRSDLADEPEYDRNTMNAWEDENFRKAVEKTGRRRLIFADLWTEVQFAHD